MTLLELSEPILTYICRLNRTARAGGQMDYHTVRADVEERFREAEQDAGRDPRLLGQWQKIELALVFFVDSMISESGLGLAREWNENRLAYDRKELAGDEKFFDMLDETLAEKTPEANERLAVFYSCIGLGFTGWYAGQEDYLVGKQKEMAARIGDHLKHDPDAYICQEAYDYNDERDLIEPPGRKLTGIVIAVVGLAVTMLVMNIFMYRQAAADLSNQLDKVIDQGEKIGQPPEEDE